MDSLAYLSTSSSVICADAGTARAAMKSTAKIVVVSFFIMSKNIVISVITTQLRSPKNYPFLRDTTKLYLPFTRPNRYALSSSMKQFSTMYTQIFANVHKKS
jgi:hypothetical protein